MTAISSPTNIESFSPTDIDPFFRVVDRLFDLYVSYRGRFVTMSQDGKIFIQKRSVKNESVPAKLTSAVMCAHLNQRISISVFAGPHSAKFICFDVDDGKASTVREIVDTCEEAGIPRSKIYVSTSGGKGYHVEIFFDHLVYVSILKDFYDWVCFKASLDKTKVEFRPTHGHAIKLPLSRNFKTGNVCWYLDRETLCPITDAEYIFEIEKVSSEAFQMIAESVREEYRKSWTVDATKMQSHVHIPFSEFEQYDDLPDLTAKGMTHKTILAITIHLKKKGFTQEQTVARLLDWYSKQDRQYLTDSDFVIRNDIKNAVKWVFSDSFVISHKQELFPTFTQGDIRLILSQVYRSDRYVLFAIMYYCKKYGDANISYDRLARVCNLSPLCVVNAINRLLAIEAISKKAGKAHYDGKSFKRDRNVYWVTTKRPPFYIECSVESHTIQHEITEDNFRSVYYTTLLRMVDRASLKKILSRSEYKKLEEYKIHED